LGQKILFSKRGQVLARTKKIVMAKIKVYGCDQRRIITEIDLTAFVKFGGNLFSRLQQKRKLEEIAEEIGKAVGKYYDEDVQIDFYL
jgi:D-tyrosyl-tRNA(Tyr) deacylase